MRKIVKTLFWLALVIALIFLGYKLFDAALKTVDMFFSDGGVISDDSGDYQYETEEPENTMPAYLDSEDAYDDLSGIDIG